ncbi:MAG: hypothetical protein JNL58_29385 [Planctomyces sp.]|nr:hypothetical protein [Planctomyces sp.]
MISSNQLFRDMLRDCGLRQAFSCFAVIVLSCSTLFAQKPPGLGYMDPPVVRPGEFNSVRLGGFDLTSDVQWFVHSSGIELKATGPAGDFFLPPPPYWFGPRASSPAPPIAREVPATVFVSPETPEGIVRWQVANANGSSETGVFVVSRGHEVSESRSRDLPQALTQLPITVSGRLSRISEVDRYQISSDRDTLITADLMARRLGSDFNGVLEVHDTEGNLIADFSDTEGFDGSVSFPVKTGQSLIVSVHDADFRGDRAFIYRLSLTVGPRVVGTIPAAVQRGKTTDVQLLGYGISDTGPGLKTRPEAITIPADFIEDIYTFQFETSTGTAEVRIPVSNEPQHVYDHSVTADAPALTGPCCVTGLLSPEERIHSLKWKAEAGEHWQLSAVSRGLGCRSDIAIELTGPDGAILAENDDSNGTTDPELRITTPVTGIYQVSVRGFSLADDSGQNRYHLRLDRQTANYQLTIPQQMNLPSGGKVELTVQAVRSGGWDGEIRLRAAGLPEGVQMSGDWLIPAGKNDAKVFLESSVDAAVVAAPVQIIGTAMLGETAVERVAVATAGGNLCPRDRTEQTINQMLLSMTLPAPFEIQVVDRERQRDVHRGTTYLAELDVVRKDGFNGEVQITMSAKQDRQRQGVRGPTIIVPPGETKAWYPCFLPEWLSTDLTRRIVVHGIAEIPDPKGTSRQVTKAGDARITMIMEGALLKVKPDVSDVIVQAGSSVQVPFRVSRSAKLAEAAIVELVLPEEAEGVFKSSPVTIAADQMTGTLELQTPLDSQFHGDWTITVRATSLQDGKWPVISQADFALEIVPQKQ